MSEERQIEEMAKWLCADCSKDVPCSLVPIGAMCKTVWKRSEALYNAGYRKQSEGEWIWTENGESDCEKYWICSVCKEYEFVRTKYCPNCGARMKGGVE